MNLGFFEKKLLTDNFYEKLRKIFGESE